MATKPKRPRDPNQLAKLVIDIATGEVEPENPDAGKDPAAVALGRKGGAKGGKKRAANMTKEQRVEAAKKAIKARWKGAPTAPTGTSASRQRRRIQTVRAKIPSPDG